MGYNISGTQYITNDALSLKYQECICSNSQAYSCPSKARGQNRYRAESGKLDHARFVIFPRLSPQHHTVYCFCSYCAARMFQVLWFHSISTISLIMIPGIVRFKIILSGRVGKLDHEYFVIFPWLSPQNHTVYCVCSYCAARIFQVLWFHYMYSDEERRFMYRTDQSHLSVFHIVTI